MKKISVRELSLVGIMAAMVYVTSAYLQIPIPTAIGATRLHMGNVMCLLSGLLLGPLWGGLAAGIGSMFFDLLNPAYIASAPFTFAFKFIMAWVCGMIAHYGKEKKYWVYMMAAALGAISYVILYLGKTFIEDHFVLGIALDVVWITVAQKGVVSVINGVVAAVVAVPLRFALYPALKRIGVVK